MSRFFFTDTAVVSIGAKKNTAAEFVKQSAGKSIQVGQSVTCSIVEDQAVLMTALTFTDGQRKKTEQAEVRFQLESGRVKMASLQIK